MLLEVALSVPNYLSWENVRYEVPVKAEAMQQKKAGDDGGDTAYGYGMDAERRWLSAREGLFWYFIMKTREHCGEVSCGKALIQYKVSEKPTFNITQGAVVSMNF